MYVKRDITSKILQEIDAKEYIAIVGPRQAGKTTLLNILVESLLDRPTIDSNQVVFETLQDPVIASEFSENPVQFITRRKQANAKTYIFLDEFQLIDSAGAKLKLIYDTIENVKIVFTGSSSLQIRNIASQMVGRILQYQLNTLSVEEIVQTESHYVQQGFDEYKKALQNFLQTNCNVEDFTQLKDYPQDVANSLKTISHNIMQHGSYPAVYLHQNIDGKITRLSNIYSTYVERDILSMLKISKTQRYFDLVKYLSLTIGSIFVNSNAQQELHIRYEDTEEFLQALEHTYIIKKITPYFSNKVKELKKSPVYYFNDLGIRNWAIQNTNDVDTRTDAGFVLENYIMRRILDNELFAHSSLHYWRKTSGAEVDFIIEKGAELIPIEVKYVSMNQPEISRSFHSFLDDYRPARGIIVTKDYFDLVENKGVLVLFIPYFLL